MCNGDRLLDGGDGAHGHRVGGLPHHEPVDLSPVLELEVVGDEPLRQGLVGQQDRFGQFAPLVDGGNGAEVRAFDRFVGLHRVAAIAADLTEELAAAGGVAGGLLDLRQHVVNGQVADLGGLGFRPELVGVDFQAADGFAGGLGDGRVGIVEGGHEGGGARRVTDLGGSLQDLQAALRLRPTGIQRRIGRGPGFWSAHLARGQA